MLYQLLSDLTPSSCKVSRAGLQVTGSEHPSYETSSEAALSILTAILTTLLAVFPLKLLMQLLPADPLYCLGK